jgi:exopolysaccharide biosynthesis polyprenyl glycosylphosphotransferase
MKVLRRHWRIVFIFVAIVVDLLGIGFSGLLAYAIRENILRLYSVPAQQLLIVVVYSGAVLIGIALVLGLYRASFHTNALHQYAIALRAYFVAVPIVFATFYFFRWYELPRVFTTLLFVILPFVFLYCRLLLRKMAIAMRARGFGFERTLLIDFGQGGPFIFRRYEVLPDLGYNIVCVASSNGTGIPADHYSQIKIAHFDTGDDLLRLIRYNDVSRVLVTTLDMPSDTMRDLVDVCRQTGTKLKILSQQSEELLRFAYITDIAGIPLYSPPQNKVRFIRAIVKRSFDLVASATLILLFSPVLLLAAASIAVESGFPVIFKQRRSLVKGGREFNFFKFRSMVKDADNLKESLYDRNESDGALFKIKDDPRTTKVGKFIRRLSIDELPQLFNVLFGDMSLVGPRPLPLRDLENMNGSAQLWIALHGREIVKPGITGLWQISGRSNLGFKEMVLLDFYYIENQSLFFDLEILIATIPVVLLGRGAY